MVISDQLSSKMKHNDMKRCNVPLPTEKDILEIEKKLDIIFPTEYHEFLKQFNGLMHDQITIFAIAGGIGFNLVDELKAVYSQGLPKSFIPIAYYEGEYYCYLECGGIGWSDSTTPNWKNLSEWIEKECIDYFNLNFDDMDEG